MDVHTKLDLKSPMLLSLQGTITDRIVTFHFEVDLMKQLTRHLRLPSRDYFASSAAESQYWTELFFLHPNIIVQIKGIYCIVVILL